MMEWLKIGIILAFGWLIPREANSEDYQITLTPEDPPIEESVAEPLHVKISEATRHRDGLWLTPKADPFKWAYVDLGSESEEPIEFKADVDNQTFDSALLTIWNWHNHPVYQTWLDPGKITNMAIQVVGRGVYQFTLDGYKNETCQKRLVRSFAVTEDLNRARETWQRDQFTLGICGFPGRYHWSHLGQPTLPEGIYAYQALDIEAETMARLGFQVARIDESMEMGHEGDDDSFRFSFRRMDAAAKAYTSRGIQLALQLMNSPDWGIEEKYQDVGVNRWRYPHRETVQRAYTRALLNQFGNDAAFVQVFNEPDQEKFWSGTPEEYLHHFQFTHEETNLYHEDLPIFNGGYSLFDKEKTEYFAEQLVGKLDAIAYHSHGSFDELVEDVEYVKKMHTDNGYVDPVLFNTEMGYDAWRLEQERRKGQYVPQKTLYCWRSGHAGALLFGSRMTLGPERRSQDFGFLDHFFCPRYVYGSVAAMVSALEGAKFEKALVEEDDLYVYQFGKGENRVISIFTTTDEQVDIEVSCDAIGAESIDAMGNRSSVNNSGNIKLTASQYPIYLNLAGVQQCQVSRYHSDRTPLGE